MDYALIDCGDGRRLERFGARLVDRPAPKATWPRTQGAEVWGLAQARFDSDRGGWTKAPDVADTWLMSVDGLTAELRLSSNGQVGFFPEHRENWRWMSEVIRSAGRPLNICNLFAYTGMATLAASAAGPDSTLCHLDGARSIVQWARRNATHSGLEGCRIRWIVDDAMTFLSREIRRGRRYDGFILDPPAFGRGPKGSWAFDRSLVELVEAVAQLLSDEPSFVILSCHARDVTAEQLAGLLNRVLGTGSAEAVGLGVATAEGVEFPLSVCGRVRF